jgi:hypothetical protein
MEEDEGTVEIQHFDCVCCQARVLNPSPEGATLIILRMMLHDGLDLEDLRQELCFYHRRRLEQEE